ncbi:LOW QUALITY PROTEIN: coagulation factor IX-like [Pituophis catenifer annectens]|uniref:LOW QUALITY PROTEIN: coagulation factor IX-like n=1 Tax=Pituophis catenifer annectens TaxID=94852 RepID=UPI0039914BD1
MAHRGFALVLGLLGSLLLAECAVFINQQKASSVLRRYRRYNSGYLEEFVKGNLERECIEEICDFEEAREVFEDDAQTVVFWKTYIDVCSMENGNCEQICRNVQRGRAACSCVDGYNLLDDQKTCGPSGDFSCGTITLPEPITSRLSEDQSNINNTKTHQGKLNIAQVVLPRRIPTQDWGQFNSWKGQVPWQVYMFSFDRKGFCEGVLISDKWVITAAHCLEYKPHTIVAGEYDTSAFEHSEQLRQILRVFQHPSYNKTRKYENDLALLELSTPLVLNKYVTPICIGNRVLTKYLLEQGRGTQSGWWKLDYLQKISNTLQRADIQYVDQVNCLQKNDTQPSPNTFCAGHPTFVRKVYHGNSGAPFATERNNTWFLTGIATCGAECTGDKPYETFTSIANYIAWIHNVIRGEL